MRMFILYGKSKMNLGIILSILNLHFILTKLRKIQNSFEGICPKKGGDTVQFIFFLITYGGDGAIN